MGVKDYDMNKVGSFHGYDIYMSTMPMSKRIEKGPFMAGVNTTEHYIIVFNEIKYLTVAEVEAVLWYWIAKFSFSNDDACDDYAINKVGENTLIKAKAHVREILRSIKEYCQ